MTRPTEPIKASTITAKGPAEVKKKMIPTQRTFAFPFFIPTFLIDLWVNRWLQSLVVNQGVVPMKGDSSAGTFMFYQSYIYTKQIEINDNTNV
jgi:hypothetical protein